MSIASRMPFDKSSSTGAGSLGTRNVRKIDSFWQSAFVYGSIEERNPYARRNAFALPLKSTCASSFRRDVVGDARVEDGVETVAFRTAQVERRISPRRVGIRRHA